MVAWKQYLKSFASFFELSIAPRGVKGDHYTMKAVAFDKKADAGSLILNEDFQLMICENSSSTCDDSVFFKGDSARTDKNCRFL